MNILDSVLLLNSLHKAVHLSSPTFNNVFEISKLQLMCLVKRIWPIFSYLQFCSGVFFFELLQPIG